jgi:hypothetical protein
VIPGEEANESHVVKMTCPHPQWAVVNEKVETDPEGKKGLVVMEKCVACNALRVRILPEGAPEEPFDYSIPVSGHWYERLYNFGNFVILARVYQDNKEVTTYMTRVETPAGNVHSGMVNLNTLFFSSSALHQIYDMELMLKFGPKRYVDYRIFQEGRQAKQEKADVQKHADTLFKVVQDIGVESIVSAKAIMEAEVDRDAEEVEVAQIEERERVLQEMKAMVEKRRSEKGK